jgi:hypothetical protein
MACCAIQITNINAAELEMQPLSDQDSNLLLQAGCKSLVSRSYPSLQMSETIAAPPIQLLNDLLIHS